MDVVALKRPLFQRGGHGYWLYITNDKDGRILFRTAAMSTFGEGAGRTWLQELKYKNVTMKSHDFILQLTQ